MERTKLHTTTLADDRAELRTMGRNMAEDINKATVAQSRKHSARPGPSEISLGKPGEATNRHGKERATANDICKPRRLQTYHQR